MEVDGTNASNKNAVAPVSTSTDTESTTNANPSSGIFDDSTTNASAISEPPKTDVNPESGVAAATESPAVTSNEPATADSSTSVAFRQKPSQSSLSLLHSKRREERMRVQALKAEQQRQIQEERALAESVKAKARSIAAKKAAATKKRAQIAASNGEVPEKSANTNLKQPQPKNVKKIVKFRYLNVRPPPVLRKIDLKSNSVGLVWLRLNIRDFLFRFDKLCRLPARFLTQLNDPLMAYSPEQRRLIALALLKVIDNDANPLHKQVKNYILELEHLDAENPMIWDWLLQFVEQLDAYAPEQVPTTEEEQLDLLRRLVVICTGTETIRITVTSDVDELKLVEKDAQEEIKQIQQKLKETEQKLAKLKAVDKQVYQDRLESARRSAQNKVFRAQQQLYTKQHKFNLRTAPLATDLGGNRYWSFQFKSALHSAWGSWIVVETYRKPEELYEWYTNLGADVDRVLKGRDELINEKNTERKQKRQKKDAVSTEEPQNDEVNGSTAANPATETNNSKKRRYPKLKLTQPLPLPEPELCYIEGRDNIQQLLEWLRGFPGEIKDLDEIANIAQYLAQE